MSVGAGPNGGGGSDWQRRSMAPLAVAVVLLLVVGSVGVVSHQPSSAGVIGGLRTAAGGPGTGTGAGPGSGAGGATAGLRVPSGVGAPATSTTTSTPPTTAPPTTRVTTGATTTTKAPVHLVPVPVPLSYPTTPPGQICGNASVLRGPTVAPAGAVRVDPGQNLYDVTLSQPPGTTFWLAPGTFTLGTGQFGQVIPKDNDVYLGAPGAILDGGNVNQYAFTQHARGVTIKFLTVQNFVSPRDQGVVNHDSGAGWVIQADTFQNNKGASVMVGPSDIVSYNCLRNNGQYGFNAFAAGGDANVTLDHNEISGNNTDNWEATVPGCGCTGGGKFWDVQGAVVTNNWIHNNHGPGLWADTDNAGFDIEGNFIADNDAEAIIYEISYNARIANNTLERNALVAGRTDAAGDTFPIPAIYISESGGDARVFGSRYSTLAITGNYLKDNWGGVTLWENADRFCGSPANTSGTFCTLGGAASLSTCVAATINQQPYLSDCRWKTQNVSVTNNDFFVDMAAIGCTTQGTCAQQAVLSQVGTSPTWSPYQGDKVQQAITYRQNNHFSGNRYHGSWRFTGFETGHTLPLGAWQAAPFNQDAASTLQTT